MNTEPTEIHKIELNNKISDDRRKYKVLYKPRVDGNREIFSDDQQYMRRKDGSLMRITEKKNKKQRAKEKRKANENNS